MFLVTSRGYMATAWLTAALNEIPGTYAVHGALTETPRFPTLSTHIRSIQESFPGRVAGIVHSVNAAMLFAAFMREGLNPYSVRTAHLTRNPIMLAEAGASVSSRNWNVDERFSRRARLMCEDVRTNRLGAAIVDWPESVRSTIDRGDETSIRRLAGIWSRISVEATEIAFYQGTLRLLHKREDLYPVFRFEDYTENQGAFRKLVEHVIGKVLDADTVENCFAQPASNKHRSSPEKEPSRVYQTWSPAERDMYNTIMLVTGLSRYFSDACLYEGHLHWDSAPPSYVMPSHEKIDGVTLNIPAVFRRLRSRTHHKVQAFVDAFPIAGV